MQENPDARPLGPPRWVTTRLARPVSDLARAATFYRDLLGLPPQGGFTGHDGYDGAFFGLPGGAQLELTSGATPPRPGTDEDLLVFSLPALADVERVGAELERSGVRRVPAANPYWNRWGRTFLDPDGYLLVLAASSVESVTPPAIEVRMHAGPRDELRSFFELAEDSAQELDGYLDAGEVLVAVSGAEVLGHLQLVDTHQDGRAEIKNMAVRADLRGRGIGARLVQAAADLALSRSRTTLVVATAAADTGNLRFYQRQGFRMRSVERDAFTPSTGYPEGLRIDGIELRDRVWLDRPLG